MAAHLLNHADLEDSRQREMALQQRNAIFAFERMHRTGVLAKTKLQVFESFKDIETGKKSIGVVDELAMSTIEGHAICVGTLSFFGDKDEYVKRSPVIVMYRGLPKYMVLASSEEL